MAVSGRLKLSVLAPRDLLLLPPELPSGLPPGLCSLDPGNEGARSGLDGLAGLKLRLALPASISIDPGLGSGIKLCPEPEGVRPWLGERGGVITGS